MALRIGLVGARGHTGRELISILSRRADMVLDFAVSRAMEGEPVSTLAPDADPALVFEALSPEAIATRGADRQLHGAAGRHHGSGAAGAGASCAHHV